MGRAKLPMKFIEKEKTRSTTYLKRKKGLKKKAQELSILCDVPICIIIYPYTAKSSSSLEPEIWPPSPKVVHQILNRYQCLPREDQQKRASNLCDILESKRRKFEQDLFKLQRKTMATKYLTWHPILDTLDWACLRRLVSELDEKSVLVKKMIVFLKKAANHGFCSTDPTLTTFQFNDNMAMEGFRYAQQPASLCGYQWEYQNPGCEYRAVDTSYQILPFGLGSDNKLLALGLDHESSNGLQNQEQRLGNLSVAGSNGSLMPITWAHRQHLPRTIHMNGMSLPMTLPLPATCGRPAPSLRQDGNCGHEINEFACDSNVDYYES
ncbi:Floral homeotic protein APETALA 3-like protein [Drosera capensis]